MKIKLAFQFIFILFSCQITVAQCVYPTANSLTGTTQTHCVDVFPNIITFSSLNTSQFVLQNVVQGFVYNFSVGDVFSGATENINIYDATTNTNLGFNSGVNGASIASWPATFSGQIKVIVSKNSCDNSDPATFSVTLGLVSIGNTLDSQTAFGTDTWVGHVYNYGGVSVPASPPPGGGSPTSPGTGIPFLSTDYIGYYNVNSETINETFGAGLSCFPILSAGAVRSNVRNETFAVRYRMRSTRPAGCYIVRTISDDGVRLYNDGIRVFNQWSEFAPTTFTNILIYLDGDADLILDYYENGGGSTMQFSIEPFVGSTNNVTAPTPATVCSNIAPSEIDGSAYQYNGAAINPTITFQWQISSDNTSWSNISGATLENYTPTAIVTSGSNIIRYYRRVVSADSNAAACSFNSNSIAITTEDNSILSSTPVATAATGTTCTSFVANWNPVLLATSYRIDVSTVNTFTSFVGVYNNFDVGSSTSLNVTGLSGNTTYFYRVRGVNSCGSSGISNIISAATLLDLSATTNTQIGATQTLCVISPASTQTFTGLISNRFILQNVVQGLTYSFSVGDVFSGATENINIYDATTNVNLASNSGANGTAIASWLATFSGQIKVIVSKNSCDNTDPSTFSVTLGLVSIGNTLDSQTAFGTDTWVGHVYNWTGGSPPGGASPAVPGTGTPFSNSEYVGFYNINSETIVEDFGGHNVCIPVLSNGVIRTNVNSETFAVRYRMRSTRPAGCYIIKVLGDNGIRIYNDNVLVFNQWPEQSPATFDNILVYLDGSAELIYDFYENAGGNSVQFNIAPFVATTNSITSPTPASVCSNIAPGAIDGTAYQYNGTIINPTINYQWQISSDNISWANISGATLEDYTPTAIVTSGTNVIRYYRRVVSAASNAAACSFNSNSILITTADNGILSATPTATAGTGPTCTSFVANWNAIAQATSYTIDVSIVNTFASFVGVYNNFNVGAATTVNITGLAGNTNYFYRIRAVNTCGSSNVSNIISIGTLNVNAPIANATTVTNCDSFVASWSTQSNATAYLFSVATDAGFTTFLAGYNNLNVGNVSSATVTGLTTGPLYYRVIAVGLCGNSSSSNIITVPINVTTWNGTAWSNGTPNLTALTFITGDYNLAASPNISACSMVVVSPAIVTVSANKGILIENNLTVQAGAQLIVENDGSLVQVSDTGVNLGNITYKRNAKNLRPLDYVYWSAPVVGVPVTSIYPSTPVANTLQWNPTIANSNGTSGNWQSSNEVMPAGKGYAIRVPNNITPASGVTITTSFVGIPHNGIYNAAVARGAFSGSDTTTPNGATVTKNDDNWNLLGNPYPSAIDIRKFILLNPDLQGSIDFWTHGTNPSNAEAQPFYGTFGNNYNANDYVTVTVAGSTAGPFNADGVIGACQGFFVKMVDGAGAASATITFNNAIRNEVLPNNQFYKNSAQNQTLIDPEKHRIWLDLIENSSNATTRILVGYMTGATQDYDRLFDATSDYQGSQSFHSLIGQEVFSIQGRALPFVNTDTVPLGIAVPIAGTYKIGIHTVDGLFANNGQTIYLQDNLTGLVHNLSVAPYTFVATAGGSKTRFVLRYTAGTLGNNNPDLASNTVLVFKDSATIKVSSVSETIASIAVFDILGRNVFTQNNINSNSFETTNVVSQQQTLLVRVTLNNGSVVTKKIVY